MKKNTFKIGNFIVNIENGFIPAGREYMQLLEILNKRTEDEGSFKMQFKNGPGQNAEVLKVNYARYKRIKPA